MNRADLEGLASGPLYWLGGFARRYPGAWRDIERARAQAGRRWPPNIYAPINIVQQFVRPGQNLQDLPWEERLDATSDATALAALAAWRMTKGIYRFDPTLAQALWETPITGRIPVGVLQNLPEWCVYVALGGRRTRMGEARGAWFHLDVDPRGDRPEARILLETDQLVPLVVRLGTTLEAGVREVGESAAQAGIGQAWGLRTAEVMPFVMEIVGSILSMVLYLCSAEPEISGRGRPGNPRPQRVKGGVKLVAVQGVQSWDVGVVLGSTLRAAQEREAREASGGVTGRTVRPHVRRAHWHTFLTGPRDRERTEVLKWLHPMLVNADGVTPEDLPAVVHRVR